jgi:3-dehydroquinate synthase
MKKLQQDFTVNFRYDVHFTRAIFYEENSLFQEVIEDQSSQLPAKMLIIVDDGVANHHPDLERSLYQYAEARPGTMQLCGSPVVVPGGERAKNDPQLVEQILVDINRHGIDRHAFVVAV